MSTSSIKRRIGRFHVVVVQWTLKKCTKKKSVMHVQSCCFAHHEINCFLTLLLSSSLSLVKVLTEQRRTMTLTQDNDFLFLFVNFDTVS